MKRITFCASALLAFLLPMAAQAAAPANDKFENARALTATAPVFLNQTGVGSTADVLDPYIGGAKLARSVWYRFDARYTTDFTRIIINDKPGVRAGVFELADVDGNAGTLKFITQTNNTLPNDIETLVFSIKKGRRYYICVEANGLFDITLQSTIQPNDYFGDAIVLPGDEGTVTGSNVNATNVDDTPPNPNPHKPGSGVWYTWTPNFNGTAVLDTNFSEKAPNVDTDTIIAVFTGNTLATLVPVASDDDSGLNNNSRVVFPAVSGTPYRIMVGGFGGNQGPFFLSYYKEGNAGVFELANVPSTVGENQGTTVFQVRRFRAGNVAASVTIGTTNGTATAGTDYNAVNFLLNFPNPLNNDNGWRQNINLTILPDTALFEAEETFNLVLSAPSPTATIGASSPAEVSILNTQAMPTNAAGFTQGIMRVKEDAGIVTIPLMRASAGGLVRMRVSSTAFSSTTTIQEGLDYEAVETTVTFLPGQTYASVPLTILNDGLGEGEESLVLLVSPETPGPDITGFEQITVFIDDDDTVLPVAGRLTALLVAAYGDITATVDIKITATGMVTGKVVMARKVFPITGKLVDGRLSVTLGVPPAAVRTLSIELVNANEGTYKLTLTDGDLGSLVTTDISVSNFTTLNPCPSAGYYTITDFEGGGGVPQIMAASLKITPLGDATLTGKLFDGTAVVCSGAVDIYTNMFVGASLYAGKGRLLIKASPRNTPQQINSGSLYLLRPGRSNQGAELPALFLNDTSIRVARWIPPAKGQRALTVWNPNGLGNADLLGGGFNVLTTKALTVSTANKVTVTVSLPEKLSLTLTPSTGLFSGTVIPTGASKPQKIFGAMLQGGPGSVGKGFFLNGILPGAIKLRGN